MDYSEQLSHPNWRKKREEALNHYGKKCSKCGASNDLQVHHKRYIKGQKAWECSLDDLEVLCMKHHRITHGIDGELKVCEYKGCKREIDPRFKYCFPNHQQRLKDLEDENSGNKTDQVEILQLKEELSLIIKAHNEQLLILTKELSGKPEDVERLQSEIADIKRNLAQISQTERSKEEPKDEQPSQYNWGCIAIIALIIGVAGWYWKPWEKYLGPQGVSGHLNCAEVGCGGVMVQKKGKNGFFYGCSKFPNCRNTIDHPLECEICEAYMEIKVNRNTGMKFWGCSRFPKCPGTTTYEYR